ncbi:hypothetical protein AGABI2DRAFT_194822 [Agaricus bisporus var. bisporus H97]|uniref:hypothetical protein n=1 Tax=Agaricus bisporus var. bisporus (strain H97 / ATCC MYA-4626 / FGSC 10389) TaxID=936046 RepID=UPI00029F597C|nr:hypothetical protein AGABI2DRAFT_194822 [Agaricus bisporus var. bisporus H97]EKV43905.1 hypothetical protein AGABI2DRAFT_194822 [Agaricus bisporus var. bisporus H97]
MAFVGPVAGALVAGGVYYGFSNLIQTRTDQIRRDLHTLSSRLVDSPTAVIAPPSAAARISRHPWTSYAESQWNQEIAYLFAGVRDWDRKLSQWGRKVLYGEQTSGGQS